MNKSKILTWEEYRKLPYKDPWFFTLIENNQWLYFLGISHESDPSHPQNNYIKEKWDEFLKLTEGLPRIVFQEGGLRDVSATEEEAITRDGEAGLIRYLSHKSNVEIISPELKKQDQLGLLTGKFERDAVAYFYFARTVDQWLRIKSDTSLELYIKSMFGQTNNYKGWEDFDMSLENFKKLHKRFLGKEFDEKDRMAFNNAINPAKDPAKEGTIINEVSQSLQRVRDEYILEQIDKYWSEGRSLFIVYGTSHAMRLEPAIKE